LYTELAAELDELDQLLAATNRKNLAQNGKYIKLFIAYQMHLIDYLITLVSVCLCVCLSTDRLSNYYVRNSLPIFTKFCIPLGNLVVSKAVVPETNRT